MTRIRSGRDRVPRFGRPLRRLPLFAPKVGPRSPACAGGADQLIAILRRPGPASADRYAASIWRGPTAYRKASRRRSCACLGRTGAGALRRSVRGTRWLRRGGIWPAGGGGLAGVERREMRGSRPFRAAESGAAMGPACGTPPGIWGRASRAAGCPWPSGLRPKLASATGARRNRRAAPAQSYHHAVRSVRGPLPRGGRRRAARLAAGRTRAKPAFERLGLLIEAARAYEDAGRARTRAPRAAPSGRRACAEAVDVIQRVVDLERPRAADWKGDLLDAPSPSSRLRILWYAAAG